MRVVDKKVDKRICFWYMPGPTGRAYQKLDFSEAVEGERFVVFLWALLSFAKKIESPAIINRRRSHV
jgi:hypothetical protein